MLYKLLNVECKKAEEKNTLEAVFSTSDTDRHGDIVLQDNWDLKSFKKNPVIINSHNYGDATEVIGKATKVSVKDGKLEGKIEFAVDANPKAKIIYDLYAGGFLKAFSVGFMVKDWNENGEITGAELLEVSAVSVPANAYALAKQKGIHVEQLFEDANTKPTKKKKVAKKEVEKVEEKKTEIVEEKKEVVEPVIKQKTTADSLNRINLVIGLVREKQKVETRSESVRVQNAKLINQAIRGLLKIKEKN